MKAYLECGHCKKHSVVDGNSGVLRCPHCQSTDVSRAEIGCSKAPDWFKGRHLAGMDKKLNSTQENSHDQ